MSKDFFEAFEPLSDVETERLCSEADAENEKLKDEIDELKLEIQELTKKNQRLQKSLEKKQLSDRSYGYLKKAFNKYVEESQKTINNLSVSLDRAERYVADVQESARKMNWRTSDVDRHINQLFESVNSMFETLSSFGIKDGKWSYDNWLRVNVKGPNGETEESDDLFMVPAWDDDISNDEFDESKKAASKFIEYAVPAYRTENNFDETDLDEDEPDCSDDRIENLLFE